MSNINGGPRKAVKSAAAIQHIVEPVSPRELPSEKIPKTDGA